MVVVEGADADILSAFGLECDALADHADNIRRVSYALDIVVWLWSVQTHAINSPPVVVDEAKNYLCILFSRRLGKGGLSERRVEPQADGFPRHSLLRVAPIRARASKLAILSP